jgi:RNA ligase (TIGR02306 family)
MSEFKVEAVKIEAINPHPGADRLSIVEVLGYRVIVRSGDFCPGEVALYVPIDAVVPLSDSRFAFLGKEGKTHHRVKAARLRGVFSMGMLVKAPDDYVVGQDYAEALGIIKFEEVQKGMSLRGNADTASPPSGHVPVYGMDNLLRYKEIIPPGTEVIITEKIHGCNARVLIDSDGVHVGSHRTWWKPEDSNVWWAATKPFFDRLPPDLTLYGEVYGKVQDLNYGVDLSFAAFDIWDNRKGVWLPWDEMVAFCEARSIPVVPVLYRGPYDFEATYKLAQGNSVLAKDQIKEGVIVKTTTENRIALKLLGEEYLLRKNGTEFH